MTVVNPWSAEEDQFIIDAIEQDILSYQQISSAVSTKFETARNRNSISGRVDRLKKMGKIPTGTRVSWKSKPRRSKKLIVVSRPETRAAKFVAPKVGFVADARPIFQTLESTDPFDMERFMQEVSASKVPLGELRAGMCRYPVEGSAAPFMFCGRLTSGSAIGQGLECPYCETHASLCYQPPRQRTGTPTRFYRRA